MTEPVKSLKEKWAGFHGGGPLEALQGAENRPRLIDGVIAPNTINWMVAPPEAFKTFIAIHMGVCIASGRPWHGRPTKKTAVLYLSAEGGVDIHIRRAAADTAANDTSKDFWVAQARPRIDDEEGFGFLCGAALHPRGDDDPINLRLGYRYSEFLKIKNLNEEEKRRFQVLDADGSGEIADYPYPLNREQWDKVCEAFGYKKWDRNLPPEKQKSHPFLRVVFDKEKGEYLQELHLEEYFESLEIAHRYKGYDLGFARGDQGAFYREWESVLIIIDTYSQTSSDDEKSTVSRYIKTLRDVQDLAAKMKYPATITFLVIDHTTKQGDTYRGSLAKLGDCDTMMKVERPNKERFATLKCLKSKMGSPFSSIDLELKPIEIEGFSDALGRPISSLYVDSVGEANRLLRPAGDTPDSAMAQVFKLMSESGPVRSEKLRQKFIDLEANRDKKPESIKKAYARAIENLKVRQLIREDSDGDLSVKVK
jgi:hypothetical protein